MANYSSPQNGTDFAATRGFTKSWFRLHQEIFLRDENDQRTGLEAERNWQGGRLMNLKLEAIVVAFRTWLRASGRW